MTTPIERLEALAVRSRRPQFMIDENLDYSSRWSLGKKGEAIEWEKARDAFHEAMDQYGPDLLKVARAAKAYFDTPSAPGWSSILVALEPLFREEPSDG